MIIIQITLQPTRHTLNAGYHHIFHGYISELVGNEHYGDHANDYVYSNLCGGHHTRRGIVFNQKPYFFIRTENAQVLINCLHNIEKKKNIFEGFTVESVVFDKEDAGKDTFRNLCCSPILLNSNSDKKQRLSPEDLTKAEEYLLRNIIRKAEECGVSLDKNLQIKILNQRKGTSSQYRNAFFTGRNFDLKITGDTASKEFILSHGLGRSNGCGYGFII